MNRDYFSLRELVVDAGFDLHVLTGDLGLNRAVKGIHLSDYEDPTPWMIPGSVLLTTGAAFAESPESADRFIEKIAAGGTVALGVAVGQHGHMDRVSPEMVRRARELGLPLFEIAETVPFRGVFAYVYNALASTDMHYLRRAVSVQALLLDLLIDEKGIQEVLSRLAKILNTVLLLFDERGKVVAKGGSRRLPEDEVQRLWGTYLSLGDLGPVGVLAADAGRSWFREVKISGRVERVMAAVGGPNQTSEFVEIALSFAQRLVRLELQRESEERAIARRTRASLLEDFLSRQKVGEDLRLRLFDEGIDLRKRWRVLILTDEDTSWSVGGKPETREGYQLTMQACASAETYLRERDVQVIGLVKSDGIVLLAVLMDSDAEATRILLDGAQRWIREESGWQASGGGASALSSGDESPLTAFRQARIAASGAVQRGSVLLFEDLGGGFRLLAGHSEEALAAIVERFITPLTDHDRTYHTNLLQTLSTFVESRLSAHEAADALYIHRNTLHKRLHRIEELLEVDLHQMDDVLDLCIALRAAELLNFGSGNLFS